MEKNANIPSVRLKGIVKRYGQTVAVEKIDLDIEEGSLVTLLGPSGCGKTTILRMIAGLEEPSEGEIFIKGKQVNNIPIYRRNLGMIFQNYALFPHKTIFHNVAFGLKYRNVSKEEIKKKVKKALEMVRLPGMEDRMPANLSGGQQQRIAMARAIVIEPDVLLMDEPLSALDEKLRHQMRLEIVNLQEMLGITTVFVTHDQREALSISDKIVVMKKGLKLQEGTPEQVYNNFSNHFVADFLGHSNFAKGVVTGQVGDWVKIKLDDGNKLLANPSDSWTQGDQAEIVIRAHNFNIFIKGKEPSTSDINCFYGTVKERSYMGGEISYFVKLESGTVLHIISLTGSEAFKSGQEVSVQVAPKHCRMLQN